MNPTRLEHDAHRLARPLPDLEATARQLARAAGYRPAVRDITYYRDWDTFTAAAHVTHTRTDTLRGLTARSRRPRDRCIWLANSLTPGQQLHETLSHELAHAMLPWRHGHTSAWLQLHTDLLTHLTSPDQAHAVATRVATQHNLATPTPRTDNEVAVALAPQPHTDHPAGPNLGLGPDSTDIDATIVADDLEVAVTRPDGTTAASTITVTLDIGNDPTAAHRASLAGLFGIALAAVTVAKPTRDGVHRYRVDLAR